ncbi:MAG: hypothetical protein JO304_22955 [Solirubrobacterales bacterium]|nr:hypothetical protein [Solirubrobacterales bacterium]
MGVLASAALAAGGTGVVPAKGQVAGEGYAYYLQRSCQITFATSPPAKPCETLTVNGRRVGLLTLKTLTPMTESYSCSEPAGRPVYAVELSNECSTFKGDHGTFGTSDSELKKCAAALFKGAKDTVTVDRQPVNVTELVATTGGYPVHVPKNNINGSGKPGNGRSAAHGYGLLFTGFSKGTHVIHALVSIGTSKWDTTWTLHVH